MAQNIHLNGGPWHDRIVVLEDGRNHFHIIQPVDEAVAAALVAPPEEGFQVVQTREGIYSQVQGTPGEYEWDGWVTHD